MPPLAASRLGLLLPNGVASEEPAVIPRRTISAIADPPHLDRRQSYIGRRRRHDDWREG